VRSVDELGDDPNDLTLDSDLTIVNIDGETREQNTLSGNRKATKIKTSGRYDEQEHAKYADC
jgi:hypothetical protein